MPRFCANLTMLFTEYPLLERPLEAAKAGFDGAEILFPYEVNAAELGTALARAKMPLALINCPPPNYADPKGPRGFAAVMAEKVRFQQSFARTIRYAGALGAEHVHIMAGVAEGPEAQACFVENLKWAAAFAPKQSLTIEPINTDDMPGYFLNSFDLALDVLNEVDAPNLNLQFDSYHAFRIEGDILGVWDKVRHKVAHIQVGGIPDRHEPEGDEFDYPAFFKLLEKQKYTGWVSGEYHPSGRTNEKLSWIN